MEWFIILLLIVLSVYLSKKMTCDDVSGEINDKFCFVVIIPLLFMILFLLYGIISAPYDNPKYEIKEIKTQKLYNLSLNGENTDNCGKLSKDGKEIIINNGLEQKYITYDEVYSEFEGESRMETISYTFDDNIFPNNIIINNGKKDDVILYIKNLK